MVWEKITLSKVPWSTLLWGRFFTSSLLPVFSLPSHLPTHSMPLICSTAILLHAKGCFSRSNPVAFRDSIYFFEERNLFLSDVSENTCRCPVGPGRRLGEWALGCGALIVNTRYDVWLLTPDQLSLPSVNQGAISTFVCSSENPVPSRE